MSAVAYHTASGSIHCVDYASKTYWRASNGTAEAEMRRDGEKLTFFEASEPKVGERLLVVLIPLGEGASFTVRETTEVVAVEELED